MGRGNSILATFKAFSKSAMLEKNSNLYAIDTCFWQTFVMF
jgi:hypothetical protein